MFHPPVLTDASLSDAALLARYTQARDQAAFAELSHRYINLIYASALRQTRGDAAMASDVTQAVFIVFARKASAVRPSSLPAWLHRVTGYAIKNACRAEKRRRRHEAAAAVQRPESQMPTTETESLLPLLDRAIASLSVADQTVIIERYLQERTLGDVAASIGSSSAATQKRLERAIEKLRIHFSRNGVVASGVVTAGTIAGVLDAAAPSSATAAPASLVTATITTIVSPAPAAIAKSILLSQLGKQFALASCCLLFLFGICIAMVNAVTTTGSAAGPQLTAAEVGPTDEPLPSNAPLTATLQGGISVELLGVGESPSTGHPWWRAGGAPMEAPYDRSNVLIHDTMNNRLVREIAYRLKCPADADSLVSALGAGSSGNGAGINQFGMMLDDVNSLVFSVPDRPAAIRFAMATGPWHTVDEVAATGGSARWSPSSVAVQVAVPVDASDDAAEAKVKIVLSSSGRRPSIGNQNLRVVAVDTSGHEHVGELRGSSGSSVGSSETYEMAGISAAQVKAVRLQTRLFDRWVEFRNISLHAGQMTQPTVLIHYDALRVPPEPTTR